MANKYCTIEDMALRFGEEELASITDRTDGDSNVPQGDDDVIEAAIADASAVIDGVLLQLFEEPQKPYSNILSLICADVARWLLYEDSLDEDGIIQRRYERALSLLSKIADGTLHVVGLVKKSPTRLRAIRA